MRPFADPSVSILERVASGADPVSRLTVDEAVEHLRAAPRRIAVVGDPDGSLLAALALALTASRDDAASLAFRTFQDGIDAERRAAVVRDALTAAGLDVSAHGLEPALFDGVDLVVARLPKHLAELEELTALAVSHAAPSVRLVAGGREKYLTRGMNEILARGFDEVRASRGRQKSRVLHAAAPRREHGIASFPRVAHLAELGLDVAAHGGAFAGPKLDQGTRVLLDHLDAALDAAGLDDDARGEAIDLGCGTGLLAVTLARTRPELAVTATDRSWAACASTRATAALADVHVRVVRDDAARSLPEGTARIILLNPPFHEGHEVVDDAANALFHQARRLLADGGVLVTVFNAHLRHRSALERLVGPTRQLARTPKFTVTLSTGRGESALAHVCDAEGRPEPDRYRVPRAARPRPRRQEGP